eukprot:scaffold991_cov128-Cylindrotheca_fusiformis.AAC.32
MTSGSSSPSAIRRPSNTMRAEDDADDQMELFMRHSSPIDRPSGNDPSPLTVRNSSPSFMTRPRSNPRNRTPMRMGDPLGSDAFPIPEETAPATNEGRRITILPTAGYSRGTHIASLRNRQEATRPVVPSKSRKQGPSHRKVRRWNNANFVNLAKEVVKVGGGSTNAAEALLRGHAHASEYRSIYEEEDERRNFMNQWINCQNDQQMQSMRDKFFEGELHGKPVSTTKSRTKSIKGPLTVEQRMGRIDKRLRHVVIRAVENSYPATMVMETFETFLLQSYYHHPQDSTISEVAEEAWKDILVEPPTVSTTTKSAVGDFLLVEPPTVSTTKSAVGDLLVTRFLFDKDSSTGGFHRLLLHALVQFHGLAATSSTTSKGRLLTATGTCRCSSTATDNEQLKLVDCILQQQKERQRLEETHSTIPQKTKKAIGARNKALQGMSTVPKPRKIFACEY